MFTQFIILLSVVGTIQSTVNFHPQDILDESFIVKRPSGEFNNSYLVVFDIDLTILDAVSTEDTAPKNWIQLNNNSWGHVTHVVEMMFFELPNTQHYLALIRKNFFKLIKFALDNKFGIVLYTRGTYSYAETIYHALFELYKHWLLYHYHALFEIQNMFDLVVASTGNGKSLELIDNIINLKRFKHVLVVDDDSYLVWCHQFLKDKFALFGETDLTLISPGKFCFFQLFRVSDLTTQLHQKDQFFHLFEEYLTLVNDGANSSELVEWLRGRAYPKNHPECGTDIKQTSTWWSIVHLPRLESGYRTNN